MAFGLNRAEVIGRLGADVTICCFALYLTMDFPDYFERRRAGFLRLIGLCRIVDQPAMRHFPFAS